MLAAWRSSAKASGSRPRQSAPGVTTGENSTAPPGKYRRHALGRFPVSRRLALITAPLVAVKSPRVDSRLTARLLELDSGA